MEMFEFSRRSSLSGLDAADLLLLITPEAAGYSSSTSEPLADLSIFKDFEGMRGMGDSTTRRLLLSTEEESVNTSIDDN